MKSFDPLQYQNLTETDIRWRRRKKLFTHDDWQEIFDAERQLGSAIRNACSLVWFISAVGEYLERAFEISQEERNDADTR